MDGETELRRNNRDVMEQWIETARAMDMGQSNGAGTEQWSWDGAMNMGRSNGDGTLQNCWIAI